MKKIILITFLTICFANAQSIRTYNFVADTDDASIIGEVFNDFHGKYKKKSGGVILQQVRFLNDVTHRVLYYGDPENWGMKEKVPQEAWSNYITVSYTHLTLPTIYSV